MMVVMVRRVSTVALLVLLGIAVGSVAGNERDEALRRDREKYEDLGGWIYGDLARGFRDAKKSGKPLFVAVRCIP